MTEEKGRLPAAGPGIAGAGADSDGDAVGESALARAGRALASAGFDERAVAAFFAVPRPSDALYAPAPPGRVRRGLGAAIALFVGGEPVERAALTMLDEDALAALEQAGLCAREDGRVLARASITAFRGALVAADRIDRGDEHAVRPPDLSAWNVAACLPPAPARLLDVGCGAGAVLLAAALRGAAVAGVDVDERALAYARINSALNGLDPARCRLLRADVRALGEALPDPDGRFDCLVFNAPLVRAPTAGPSPLYLHAPGGEALPAAFLAACAGLLTTDGEGLCHSQLTEGTWAAACAAGRPLVAIVFAHAVDGTPHALLALGAAGAVGGSGPGPEPPAARVFVPLGDQLPHLGREVLDRVRAALRLAQTSDDPTLMAAIVRPAPWLTLERSAAHDGARFRERALRFGGVRVDDATLALLAACDGRPLGEALTGELAAARSAILRGWLVP